MEKKEVPIWEKANLTIEEAAAYFGIGTNKLREITSNPDCEFVIWIGTKRLIKRKKFEKYLEDVDAVQGMKKGPGYRFRLCPGLWLFVHISTNDAQVEKKRLLYYN